MMRLLWWRKSKNPLFDEQFWATDPLGMNTTIARAGVVHHMLRRMSDTDLVTSIDALVMDPAFKADVEFYQRELQRREQARTNRLLMLLAFVATVAALVQGSEAAWSLIDRVW